MRERNRVANLPNSPAIISAQKLKECLGKRLERVDRFIPRASSDFSLIDEIDAPIGLRFENDIEFFVDLIPTLEGDLLFVQDASSEPFDATALVRMDSSNSMCWRGAIGQRITAVYQVLEADLVIGLVLFMEDGAVYLGEHAGELVCHVTSREEWKESENIRSVG